VLDGRGVGGAGHGAFLHVWFLRNAVKAVGGFAFKFDMVRFGAGLMSGLKPPTYKMRRFFGGNFHFRASNTRPLSYDFALA